MKQFPYLLILSFLVSHFSSSVSTNSEIETKILPPANEIRTFISGFSLIYHDFEVAPPTPSIVTSEPHWFVEFSDSAGMDSTWAALN